MDGHDASSQLVVFRLEVQHRRKQGSTPQRVEDGLHLDAVLPIGDQQHALGLALLGGAGRRLQVEEVLAAITELEHLSGLRDRQDVQVVGPHRQLEGLDPIGVL